MPIDKLIINLNNNFKNHNAIHFSSLYYPVLIAMVIAIVSGLNNNLTYAQSTVNPIHIIFDVHADPMGNTIEIQELQYHDWIESTNWALDTVDLFSAKISFLSTGQFMEWVDEDPIEGWPLIERLYANGNQISTHSHNKVRFGYKDWRAVGNDPPKDLVEKMWADHINLVDTVIEDALDISDPLLIRKINCVRGSHIPSDSVYRFQLMQDYNFTIHQQGPDEDFYSFFPHHPMNVYRPSEIKFLEHDPYGSFVVSPFGPVLGEKNIHKGVEQDMRLPAVQARFILEILNWLHDQNVTATDKIWVTGWAAHCQDLMPGTPTRAALQPYLQWLSDNFVGQSVGGHIAAQFSSMTAARDAYYLWEQSHPEQIPFNYSPAQTDWTLYPYLVPTASYLLDTVYEQAMPDKNTVRWHKLIAEFDTPDPYSIYVAYTTDGIPYAADLSAELGNGLAVLIDPAAGGAVITTTDSVTVPSTGTIIIPPDRVKDLPAMRLSATDMVKGEYTQIETTCVTPGQKVYFLYSFAGSGSIYVPILDLHVDLAMPIINFATTTGDFSGKAVISQKVPDNTPLKTIWLQAVQKLSSGGAIKSNVVQKKIMQ